MRDRTANHSSLFPWCAAALLSGVLLAGGCGLDENIVMAEDEDQASALLQAEQPDDQGAAADPTEQSLIARYGVLCIHNGTRYGSINYSLQWGDGAWTEYSVSGWRWHAWRYDIPGRPDAPDVRIEFDSDFSDATSWVRYRLRTTPAAEEDCSLGTQYRFEDDGTTGRYIDLYEIV